MPPDVYASHPDRPFSFLLTLLGPCDILTLSAWREKLFSSAIAMISLEARSLGKWFGRRRVFDGISFILRDRGSLAVTGRNGSGKTTLLRILCGLLGPSCGEVLIRRDGRKLDGDEGRNLMGLVMPDLNLYGELTALENLFFLSRIRGWNLSREALGEKIAQVGLQNREGDLVSSFSSGMKQRLKLAFALLGDPKILILDEPTVNLDEEGLSLVERLIDSHRKSGMVIIATNEKSDTRHAEQTIHLG